MCAGRDSGHPNLWVFALKELGMQGGRWISQGKGLGRESPYQAAWISGLQVTTVCDCPLAVWLCKAAFLKLKGTFFFHGDWGQSAFTAPFLGSLAWKWGVLLALVRSVKTKWRQEKL